MSARSDRLPVGVYVLALGTFCVGTSEFMIAGLLPAIATDLGVTVPQAGMLITAFALGMVVGAPLMALATLRLPPRATLLGAAAVFALANALPVVLDGYVAQVGARVVAALACATYWAVAVVMALRLAGPRRTARALAVVVGGLTLANLFGVPAGTAVGERFGWRAAFLAVALMTVAAALLLRVSVPAQTRPDPSTATTELLRQEVRAFGDRRLLLALATTASFQAAVFCAFSYIAPLLIEVSGVTSGRVPVVLALFGVGALIGVTVSGRVADRDQLVNVFVSLAATATAMLLLIVVSSSAVGATLGVFLLGVSAFSIAAALNARVLGFAGDAPTLAASVNVSAFNVGNAVGPWIGGLVIGAGLGYRAPLWAAVALTFVAAAVAYVSWRVERSGPTSPSPGHDSDRAGCATP